MVDRYADLYEKPVLASGNRSEIATGQINTPARDIEMTSQIGKH
jgi:hypothetical protein